MAAKQTYRGSEYTKFKKLKLQRDDEVLVITGKEKGKKGKIVAFDKKRDRVFVEGVNLRKKYIRPSQENPQGSVVELPAPLHISNVMLSNSGPKKRSRVGFKTESGKKVRISKADGKEV
jgi:large subunit ribosomal protein L24